MKNATEQMPQRKILKQITYRLFQKFDFFERRREKLKLKSKPYKRTENKNNFI